MSWNSSWSERRIDDGASTETRRPDLLVGQKVSYRIGVYADPRYGQTLTGVVVSVDATNPAWEGRTDVVEVLLDDRSTVYEMWAWAHKFKPVENA